MKGKEKQKDVMLDKAFVSTHLQDAVVQFFTPITAVSARKLPRPSSGHELDFVRAARKPHPRPRQRT